MENTPYVDSAARRAAWRRKGATFCTLLFVCSTKSSTGQPPKGADMGGGLGPLLVSAQLGAGAAPHTCCGGITAGG